MEENREEFVKEINTWFQKTKHKRLETQEEGYQRRLFRYVGVLIVVVLIISGTLWGTYQRGWVGWWSRTILSIFNLPVAEIGKHKILFRDYFKERAPVEFFLKTDNNSSLAKSDISHIVLQKMIENEIIRILLEEKGIVVSDMELKEARGEFFPGISRQTLAKASFDSYHLSENDFRDTVIRPLLERKKLATELGGETALQRAIQEFREENEVKIFVK